MAVTLSSQPEMGASVTQECMVELCAALGNVEQLAGQVSSRKEEALKQEVAVLRAIIDRIASG